MVAYGLEGQSVRIAEVSPLQILPERTSPRLALLETVRRRRVFKTSCSLSIGYYFGAVKLLFIADIVGQPGRRVVKELVPTLRQRHQLDLVIANGENSAGGSGITPKTAEEIFAAGVDVITSGDHLWDQKEVMELLASEKPFVRPLNYPAGTPGQGSTLFCAPDRPAVAIINLQGRTFMPALDNPFHAALAEVERLRKFTKLLFIDFHAEATSEKVALTRMLDGRVSAVIGTHTHVQTADEQIFPGGTAFLCDAGFTGPHESVIGREIDPIIQRFLTNMPQRFEVAKGAVILQGALVEIDDISGRALKIERVSERIPADPRMQQ
jgi:metallophosphoesterase (TIGR00282 family)